METFVHKPFCICSVSRSRRNRRYAGNDKSTRQPIAWYSSSWRKKPSFGLSTDE